MSEMLWYTFEIAGQHVGYSLLKLDDEQLYSETRALFGEVEIDNVFELALQNGRVTAFRYNDLPGGLMDGFPVDAWPSCAYPLLLEKAQPEFVYQAIEEGSAEITGTRRLIRKNDTIIEYDSNRTTRTFWLDGRRVIKIDWGGAISQLVETAAEAKAGTPFA